MLLYCFFAENWQTSFQVPATIMMEGIINLHHDIMMFLVAIFIFVAFFLVAILALFVRRPVFKGGKSYLQWCSGHGVTHDTVLETVWTIVPTVVLLFIVTPSFALIYALDEITDPELTLRVVGRQWYWTYEYPDPVSLDNPQPVVGHVGKKGGSAEAKFTFPGFSFNAYSVGAEDLVPGGLRLLETDRVLALPCQTVVRLLITSYDVLHTWALPAFGVKVDAVPGRINEHYVWINYLGTFYGQCSEICGVNHGFMPIKCVVLTPTEFVWWFACNSLLIKPQAQ